jgi:hypothetical protein
MWNLNFNSSSFDKVLHTSFIGWQLSYWGPFGNEENQLKFRTFSVELMIVKKNVTVTVLNIYTKVSKCYCEVSSRTSVSEFQPSSLSWDYLIRDSITKARKFYVFVRGSQAVNSRIAQLLAVLEIIVLTYY